MDADVLAERILLDLKNTFKKDPLIDEFDILPIHESMYNKCPVIHIEHKVALEEWCVKHVYIYAYSNFLKWRKHPYKIDYDNLLSWTNAILLINPEFETAWNARKELILKNIHVVKKELKFSEVVLSRKPKCSQAFAHRKWILMQLKKNEPIFSCSFQQIIDHELILCTRVANLYPNNYYAWCHRIWIIQELLNMCSKAISDELECMEQWISTHISDYSGFHYRQFLLSCFFNKIHVEGSKLKICNSCPLHGIELQEKECLKYESNGDIMHFNDLLQKELNLLNDLQLTFPGHETLWNHRRYILHELSFILSKPSNISLTQRESAIVEHIVQYKKHKLECNSCIVFNWNVSKEDSFLHKCLNLAKNNTWERNLIIRHVAWLSNVISWTINLTFS